MFVSRNFRTFTQSQVEGSEGVLQVGDHLFHHRKVRRSVVDHWMWCLVSSSTGNWTQPTRSCFAVSPHKNLRHVLKTCVPGETQIFLQGFRDYMKCEVCCVPRPDD